MKGKITIEVPTPYIYEQYGTAIDRKNAYSEGFGSRTSSSHHQNGCIRIPFRMNATSANIPYRKFLR
jgi:hypothetical protein